MTGNELYLRGLRTAVACWERIARGTVGAGVDRRRGVAAAVFPNEPELTFYNNAVLEIGLAGGERAEAVEAAEAVYAAADVGRFALWVHESDGAMRRDLERRGYTLDTATRAMGMSLDDVRLPLPELELGTPDRLEHLRIIGVPGDLLRNVEPDAFRLLAARRDGENVATAMAFDHDGDCGIYNVGTIEHARRRGVGTALTAALVHDAVARGHRTASLQATPVAERMYAAVGFRDLGRILEYVPPRGRLQR